MNIAPPLPSVINCLAETFFRTHRFFCLFGKSTTVATRATVIWADIAGLLLSCCAGNNGAVRMTARVVMITTRALAAAKTQIAFAKSFWALKASLSINYNHPPPETVSHRSWQFLPVSQQMRMSGLLNRTIALVKDIARHVFAMAVALILTSCHILALAKAIQGDEATTDQAVREIFTNCCACADDSEELLRDLARYEEEIYKLLSSLGGIGTSERMGKRMLQGCQLTIAVCYPFLTIAAGVRRGIVGHPPLPVAPPSLPLTTGAEIVICATIFGAKQG